MVTRVQKSEQTKRRLAAAAIELFANRSYESTGVGDIAAAAGVTKGGFYHHYTSKEDLLLSIQESAIDRVIEESQVVIDSQLSAADTLRALVRIQLHVVTEHRDALVASVSERKALEPEKWAEIKIKRKQIECLIVDTIVRGQRTNEFPNQANPRLLTYGILGMCYWSNVWYRSDSSGWSIDEIGRNFTDLALNGLLNA